MRGRSNRGETGSQWTAQVCYGAAFLGLLGCNTVASDTIETTVASGSLEPQVIVVRKPDFIDEDGSRYVWQRTITPGDFDTNPVLVAGVGEGAGNGRGGGKGGGASRIEDMSAAELAAKLRSRMLRDGEEYLLDHDPIDLAERVLADLRAGREPPTTPERRPDFAALVAEGRIPAIPSIDSSVHTENIIGPDSRTSYDHQSVSWPAMTSLMVEGRNCTATTISTRMAVSAAHCFYNGSVSNFGTGRYIPYASNTAPTQPYGTFTSTAIYYPVGWNGYDWSFDYAQVRFAAGTFNSWGNVSTGSPFNNQACNMWGFPDDKPYPQLWLKQGSIFRGQACPGGTTPCLARYSYYCATRRSVRHNLDIMPGDSGAGLLNQSASQLVGIQSTQWQTVIGGVTYNYYNEAKAWDTVVYNYFAGSGIWP